MLQIVVTIVIGYSNHGVLTVVTIVIGYSNHGVLAVVTIVIGYSNHGVLVVVATGLVTLTFNITASYNYIFN